MAESVEFTFGLAGQEEFERRAAEVERALLNFTIKMRWLAVQMRRQLAAINAREGIARSDPFAHRRVATKGRRRGA